MKRLYCLAIIGLIISSCATGRTDFKVVEHRTPVQTPEVTPVATSVPAPGPAEEMTSPDQNQENDQIMITVKAGDTLSELCRKHLGNPRRYPEIAEYNRINDPDLILPGQKIVFSRQVPAPAGQVQYKNENNLEKSKHAGATQKDNVILSAVTATATATVTATPVPAIDYPSYTNKAFAPGERLFFSVEYFGIAAGYATLSVEEGIEINGRPTYHLIATARTHPAFEWFFKVRDKIGSYMDKQGIFSWRYEKHLHEGDYKNDTILDYNQLERKVVNRNGRDIYDAPPWAQDVLSLFYYYRVAAQDEPKTVVIPVVADNGKHYEVSVKILKKEKITVPAGTFNCLKVEPLLKFEGLFKHQGKLYIWITNDKRKVPVLIRSKIVIGSIDIVLRDAQVMDIK